MKPHIYRPGDKVRIVNPKFVRRVGYPLVWYEIDDEQLYADPRICGALAALQACGAPAAPIDTRGLIP